MNIKSENEVFLSSFKTPDTVTSCGRCPEIFRYFLARRAICYPKKTLGCAVAISAVWLPGVNLSQNISTDFLPRVCFQSNHRFKTNCLPYHGKWLQSVDNLFVDSSLARFVRLISTLFNILFKTYKIKTLIF